MYASPSELDPGAPHESRRHARTHLFLGAVLYSKARSCPVHVRDISPTGALIEGSIVPDVGEELVLRRAKLEASARIVWKVDRKAGIAFTSMIHVAEWMAKQASTHQGHVDQIIQNIRSGSAICPGEAGGRPQPSLSMIEVELEALKKNLTELEHGLIGDVVLIATHPEIQLLDVALQSVERMQLNLHQLSANSCSAARRLAT
jgi:hypothetical protein